MNVVRSTGETRVRPPIPIERTEEYARWFRCLSDGTRVHILGVVARAGRDMTVGEIVEEVGKSQSTVSRHLQILADECFVRCEADGVRTLVRVNPDCMVELPRAAAEIMGAPAPDPTDQVMNKRSES